MAEETLKEVLLRNQVDAYELAIRSYARIEIVQFAIEGHPVNKTDARKLKQAIWDAGVNYTGEIPTSSDEPDCKPLPQTDEALESRYVLSY